MCKKEDNSICFGLGMLAGMVGGIVAAVLLAPKPGSETRKELSNSVCKFVEKHSPTVNEVKRKTIETLDVLKCKVERKCENLSKSLKAKNMAKAKEKEFEEYNMN